MPEEIKKLREELAQVNQRLTLLENLLFDLVRTNKYKFSKSIEMQDGRNIEVNTGTGTRIGTATGQKIGFYNVTPIVQRSGSAQAAVSGTADSTYSANEVTLINDIVTLLNELRAWAVAQGFIKGSA